MTLSIIRHLSLVVLLSMVTPSLLSAQINCENDNPALQAMGKVKVTFERADDTTMTVEAKHASDVVTRAAGFQRVCAERIATTLILFTFDTDTTPQFHMNNVVAPLDIAFIDKEGRIESVQLMQTYSLLLIDKPRYGPARPIVAALEAHDGFYAKHNIDTKAKVTWELVDKNLND